jgi:hypothetical protein
MTSIVQFLCGVAAGFLVSRLAYLRGLRQARAELLIELQQLQLRIARLERERANFDPRTALDNVNVRWRETDL